MSIFVKENAVYMTSSSRPNVDPELAWRLAFSASCGGVLRWFLVPAATKEGYPKHKIGMFKAMAADFECNIELLRSRKGHMCLMLIPKLNFPEFPAVVPLESEVARFRVLIQQAREVILPVLGNTSVERA